MQKSNVAVSNNWIRSLLFLGQFAIFASPAFAGNPALIQNCAAAAFASSVCIINGKKIDDAKDPSVIQYRYQDADGKSYLVNGVVIAPNTLMTVGHGTPAESKSMNLEILDAPAQTSLKDPTKTKLTAKIVTDHDRILAEGGPANYGKSKDAAILIFSEDVFKSEIAQKPSKYSFKVDDEMRLVSFGSTAIKYDEQMKEIEGSREGISTKTEAIMKVHAVDKDGRMVSHKANPEDGVSPSVELGDSAGAIFTKDGKFVGLVGARRVVQDDPAKNRTRGVLTIGIQLSNSDFDSLWKRATEEGARGLEELAPSSSDPNSKMAHAEILGLSESLGSGLPIKCAPVK